MEAHSGHYRPTEENFAALIEILTKMGADLTMAKVSYCLDIFWQSQLNRWVTVVFSCEHGVWTAVKSCY